LLESRHSGIDNIADIAGRWQSGHMTNRQLEVVRWASAGMCFAIIAFRLWNPALATGGMGAVLFFGFLLFGLPVAMISIHLHGRKWFGGGKAPKL
jgi:hypothetical protein